MLWLKLCLSDVSGTSKLIVDMSQKGGLGLDNPGSVITYKTQIEEILTGNSTQNLQENLVLHFLKRKKI